MPEWPVILERSDFSPKQAVLVVPADLARELYEALKGELDGSDEAIRERNRDPGNATHGALDALARYEKEVGE